MQSLPENNIDKYEKLQQAIEGYRKSRERLVNIQEMTKKSFNQISNVLTSATTELLECINVENLLEATRDFGVIASKRVSDLKPDLACEGNINENQLKIGNTEMENPALAIVGQVKAGKSTLVNNLLKKNVVNQAYERCTARLTKLTYSSKNCVKLVDSNGNIVKKVYLKGSKIPDKYLKLKDEDRRDLTETTKVVIGEINNQFLKNGIDIIDTPGLNEYSTLSNLSKNMVKSIVPVMVYVIDGRTSVKQTDISDLLELKNSVPNLQIMYFITKLDTDDQIESENNDPIKLAEFKMDMAFKKLQYNNFIPSTFNHWSECTYFHGASLYAYMDYYKNTRTPETTYHFNMFSKFEESLSYYLLIDFENKINEASDAILNFQMDILTKIINRSKNLVDLKVENSDQIEKMEILEERIFQKIESVIKDSKSEFKNLLVGKLNNESAQIFEQIKDISYPNWIGVPESGMVIDRNLIEDCQKFIMYFICQGLENIIKKFVEDELFRKYQSEIEDHITTRMRTSMEIQELDLWKKNPFAKCLDRILMTSYKLNLSSISPDSAKTVNVLKLMNIILKSIKKVLWRAFRIDTNIGCVDVKCSNWTKKQAKTCLSKCNYLLLAEEVCASLIDDLQIKHQHFVDALENEKKFMEKQFAISDVMRKEIIKYSSDFMTQLMLTLNVKSQYMLLGLEEKERIGAGREGIVTQCVLNGIELAKKTYIRPTKLLYRTAEEVYYSYLFEHPRLLPLIAISIQDVYVGDFKEISIYTPRMKADVLAYISNNNTSFEERLKIGLQTAEALRYLHNQQIIHRDLKLANILLDYDNNVHLADYGCCKWVVLCGESLVGTPIHMAPEIIMNIPYTDKVDIYAFGILLWYLAEGKGNHPEFATYENEYFQVLWAAASLVRRPERLDNMTDELWNLMSMCWHKDPDFRPNINDVIKTIQELIRNCSI